VLHLTRQFELAGRKVVADCPEPYTISHVQLGDVITVTLSGPEGRREATARGLSDLPALYSQQVRSLVGKNNVVDRSNVTEDQATALRVHTDSYFYARLGYGAIFSDRTLGRPALGFGHRSELDSFAIDVSFLNLQVDNHYEYSASSSASSGSLLRLEGLYYLRARANASPYFGGGIGYGHTSVGSAGQGSGLQGELTAGYEIARTTNLRVFVQADASLPFYNVTSRTNGSYVPSIVFSLGLGWQRNHR